jgi:hypothetical protein
MYTLWPKCGGFTFSEDRTHSCYLILSGPWSLLPHVVAVKKIFFLSQSVSQYNPVSVLVYKRAWLLHVTFVLNTCCYSQCDSAAVLIYQSEGCVLNEMSRGRAVGDSDSL